MTSTSYPANLCDWKGLFIRHLADALARREDLHLHLWAPPGEMHSLITPMANPKESAFLARLMQQGGIAHLLRTGKISAVLTPVKLLANLRAAYLRAESLDIYHINWLQNALPLPSDGKPLLVSVLGTDMQLLSKPMMRALLRRVFSSHPTVICPNADWMVAPLTSAFADVAEIRVVPFGIDPRWYAITRNTSKTDTCRWLAVTRITRAKLGPLLEWGEPIFKDRMRELHLFGPMQESVPLPEWVHYHGPASPQTLCRDWFPTAQGLITLSQHAEGRPQVMLEAMASGLPIVASRLPAHENIVFHAETGWLCDSLEDVEHGISFFEEHKNNQAAAIGGRAWVAREIGTWDDCATRYARIYKSLLEMTGHD